MMWPWMRKNEARRQRDHALVRAVQLEAQLREMTEQRDALRRELAAERQALERVVDNALFAAGAAPVFHPEDARFRPKPVEQQAVEAGRARPALSPAEWRRKVETLDREAAERDRKVRAREELAEVAEQARASRQAEAGTAGTSPAGEAAR